MENSKDGQQEPWWPEEDDEWSEKLYYETLAAHLSERYNELLNQPNCE